MASLKIDLHVHAKERSACSVAAERDLIEKARANGLDALAFTDHGRLVPRDHLAELNVLYAPFCIFNGIEIHTIEEEDVLVFGLEDPQLESMKWCYADLHQFVRDHNGYLILAHPFRYRDSIQADLQRYPPDAIEARSLNIPPQNEPRIKRLAHELGIAIVYSSDAHAVEGVGAFHLSVDGNAKTMPSLLSLLRAHAFTCAAR